jgi:hypothetical protein
MRQHRIRVFLQQPRSHCSALCTPLPKSFQDVDASQWDLHSARMTTADWQRACFSFPDLYEIVQRSLFPILRLPMTRKQIMTWPCSKPYAYHVACRLVADGIADWADPFSEPEGTVAMGLLDITAEPSKCRWRILSDLLWLNAYAVPQRHVRFTPLPALRTMMSLLVSSSALRIYAVTFDLKKAFYQFKVPLAFSNMTFCKILDPVGMIRYLRLLRMGMGYVNAVDACHALLVALCRLALQSCHLIGNQFLCDPYVDGVLFMAEEQLLVLQFTVAFLAACADSNVTVGDKNTNSPLVAAHFANIELDRIITHRGLAIHLGSSPNMSSVMLKPSFCAKAISALAAPHPLLPSTAKHIHGFVSYIDYAILPPIHQRSHAIVRCLAKRRVSKALLKNEISAFVPLVRSSLPLDIARLPVVLTVSDASDLGWALCVAWHGGGFMSRGRWSAFQASWHINERELYPIAIATAALAPLFPDGAIMIPVLDSTVAVSALLRRYSASLPIHTMCRLIRRPMPVVFSPVWVASLDNPMDYPTRSFDCDDNTVLRDALQAALALFASAMALPTFTRGVWWDSLVSLSGPQLVGGVSPALRNLPNTLIGHSCSSAREKKLQDSIDCDLCSAARLYFPTSFASSSDQGRSRCVIEDLVDAETCEN